MLILIGDRLCRKSTHAISRPAEVDLLIGDASKAKEKLGWTAKTPFKELVRIMLKADLEEEGLTIEQFKNDSRQAEL